MNTFTYLDAYRYIEEGSSSDDGIGGGVVEDEAAATRSKGGGELEQPQQLNVNINAIVLDGNISRSSGPPS